MAIAINRLGELTLNGCIDADCYAIEERNVRRDEAGKLIKDSVLVLHLHHETGGLEEALPVPIPQIPERSGCGVGIRHFLCQREIRLPQCCWSVCWSQWIRWAQRCQIFSEQSNCIRFTICSGAEHRGFVRIDQPLMLLVEAEVEGGQCIVLIDTPITSDEVLIK